MPSAEQAQTTARTPPGPADLVAAPDRITLHGAAAPGLAWSGRFTRGRVPLRLGRLLTRGQDASGPCASLCTHSRVTCPIHSRATCPIAHLVHDCRYEDDRDEGEWFLYTGSGGRDLSGNKRTSKVPPPTPLSTSTGVRA